jgi:hypothetical protein
VTDSSANGGNRSQQCHLRRSKLLYHSVKVAGPHHPCIGLIPRFHWLDSLQYLRAPRKPGD